MRVFANIFVNMVFASLPVLCKCATLPSKVCQAPRAEQTVATRLDQMCADTYCVRYTTHVRMMPLVDDPV